TSQAFFADTANSLDGYTKNDFILTNTNTSLNQANVESVFTASNYTQLMALLSGNATSVFSSASAPISIDGQRLTNVNSPSVGTDATNKTYVDGNLGGQTLDLTGIGTNVGNGDTLVWNASQDKWTAGT